MHTSMQYVNTISTRKALNHATTTLAQLPMPQWPEWLQYVLMAMESEAESERIEATADEIREILETVRASLDDRLESGKWQPI